MELLQVIVVSTLWIYSALRKLKVEMANTNKYSSFNEQRYARCG